jgi:hypothetical protein
MPESARDCAAADDLAAQRNEQVAEGHQWAADATPNSSGNLHSDAASKHRRTAGKDRSKAQAARDEGDEQ